MRLSTGDRPGSARTTSPNEALGTATTTRFASSTGASGDRRRGDAGEVDVRRVARVAPRLADRGRLLRVAAGERHLVPVVDEQARERRPPRAAAHDDDVHEAPRIPAPMLFGALEVDRDRHALERRSAAQLVLDPVAVVARHEAAGR